MKVVEEVIWKGQPLTVAWHDKAFAAPRDLITQASGICFTDEGTIVLVSGDGKTWQLVGGHPEEGETPEAAFTREVTEEACATVTDLMYLGAQEVGDPHNQTGPTIYYQARYWARVTLAEFVRAHEIVARKCIGPSAVKATLDWRTTQILDALLQAAFACEHEYSQTHKPLT